MHELLWKKKIKYSKLITGNWSNKNFIFGGIKTSEPIFWMEPKLFGAQLSIENSKTCKKTKIKKGESKHEIKFTHSYPSF